MESNQDLYKQAILDAKAVRETAMAAARTTLAEHFEPKIKEMMRLQLSEDMDEASDMEESMDMEEYAEHQPKDEKEAHKMAESDMEESTLDEILAELNALSEDMDEDATDDSIDEAKESVYTDKAGKKSGNKNGSYSETAKTSHGDHKLHEADDEDADDAPEGDDDAEAMPVGGEMGAEGGEDAQEVVDITVGDLKDIIRDVFMQLQGGGAPEGDLDAGTEMAADMGVDAGEEDKEISLEEILAELEAEESKKMEESAEPGAIPGGQIQPKAGDVNKVEEELNEAIRTIKALKTELNEVNLFNAKMLYVNKIFKAKNLNEAQKTKVINAFDRVTSVKEVENTYKTLVESLGEVKKSSLKESVGFASKPIGNAPARPIVEADAFVNRWQILAGIK